MADDEGYGIVSKQVSALQSKLVVLRKMRASSVLPGVECEQVDIEQPAAPRPQNKLRKKKQAHQPEGAGIQICHNSLMVRIVLTERSNLYFLAPSNFYSFSLATCTPCSSNLCVLLLATWNYFDFSDSHVAGTEIGDPPITKKQGRLRSKRYKTGLGLLPPKKPPCGYCG